MADTTPRASAHTLHEKTRAAEALAAQIARERLDCNLRSIELLVEEAGVMLRLNWNVLDMERCAAVLEGAAALSRETRRDSGDE